MSTRLLVSSTLFNGADVTLDGDRAKYLGKVLRARLNDEVTLLDGNGLEWRAVITAMARGAVTLRVDEGVDPGTESPLAVHLVQGVSRGERMDLVVQKATELGATRITPVITEFSVVKLNAERATKRQAHWQKVAASAVEQCGRVQVPTVDYPIRLTDWFGEARDPATSLILTPGAGQPLAELGDDVRRVCVLVGPEGGFSPSEAADAELAGFRATSIGPRILRTETAAIAVITAIQTLRGDMA